MPDPPDPSIVLSALRESHLGRSRHAMPLPAPATSPHPPAQRELSRLPCCLGLPTSPSQGHRRQLTPLPSRTIISWYFREGSAPSRALMSTPSLAICRSQEWKESPSQAQHHFAIGSAVHRHPQPHTSQDFELRPAPSTHQRRCRSRLIIRHQPSSSGSAFRIACSAIVNQGPGHKCIHPWPTAASYGER